MKPPILCWILCHFAELMFLRQYEQLCCSHNRPYYVNRMGFIWSRTAPSTVYAKNIVENDLHMLLKLQLQLLNMLKWADLMRINTSYIPYFIRIFKQRVERFLSFWSTFSSWTKKCFQSTEKALQYLWTHKIYKK